MPPESTTFCNKSRRNCGLPPERVATTSSTCPASGVCWVASCARRSASCGASGLSSMRTTVSASGATNPLEPWRANAKSHGWVPISPSRYASSSAEASSMWCAFSISINCGPGITAARKRATDSCTFARRLPCASISTSGVAATSRPNGTAISGSHGARSGALFTTSSRRRSAMTISGSSRPNFMNSRSSSLHTAYGADAVYASQVACCLLSPAAASRRASSRRVLPIPESPTTSIRRPAPARALANALRITPSSALRPVSGRR